ncbi:MAG TPA: extracellular solute-binding protein [Arthrobacter sp.]
MNKRFTRILATSVAAAALVGGLGACSKGSASATTEGTKEITMWTHNAGNPDELKAIQSIVDSYNKSSGAKAQIKVQAFPQESYNDSVVAAASAGKLPCIVDIDGPNVPNWAWAKYLTPLKLSTDLSNNLPSTVAKWQGETYAVGYYDVALSMLARKSDLAAAGVRPATSRSRGPRPSSRTR